MLTWPRMLVAGGGSPTILLLLVLLWRRRRLLLPVVVWVVLAVLRLRMVGRVQLRAGVLREPCKHLQEGERRGAQPH